MAGFDQAARRMAAELYPNCPDSLAFPVPSVARGGKITGDPTRGPASKSR